MFSFLKFRLSILLIILISISLFSQDNKINLSGKVEWRKNTYYIAGVWNHAKKDVEWRKDTYRIAGIWNPATKEVEWRKENYRIAGVWIPNNPNDYERYLIEIGLY